ncbi:MAG: 2-C-methyl-D-erythritol 4-phosphate cytidylyltransferase [Verrucomicrobia bacterium]|nr:2-C-methyl-D-erythritol 4-phosphate cytidylyltransferase [Verrucomicrobiota bacterium]
MTSAILVAAGKSTRMGAGVDKLFLAVAGQPLVAHTWQRFDKHPGLDEIILVIRDEMQGAFQHLAAQAQFKKRFHLVPGGKERQDSVWNGLKAVSSNADIVVIQDAARPCTSPQLIADTIQAAREVGAAVAAQRVTDTIKESDGGTMVQRTIDRSRLWAVQTPQTFRTDVLRRALALVRQKSLLITDDTAACELIGQPVKLVESAAPNPKITSPADLPFVELLLKTL